MILVSTSHCLQLYHIPDLQPVQDGVHPTLIAVKCVYRQNSAQLDTSKLTSCLCSHHAGNRLPAVGFTPQGPNHILTLPMAGSRPDLHTSEVDLKASAHLTVRHNIMECAFGPTRAVFNGSMDRSVCNLRIATHSTFSQGHIGYMRLGRSEAVDPRRICEISVSEAQLEGLLDIAYDEGSGTILILLDGVDGKDCWQGHEILHIDLI